MKIFRNLLKKQGKIIKRPPAEITVEDTAAVVSLWTGIPVSKISKEEEVRLLNLEDELKTCYRPGQRCQFRSKGDPARTRRIEGAG